MTVQYNISDNFDSVKIEIIMDIKVTSVIVFFLFLVSPLSEAQTYNPTNGETAYPNGTVYKPAQHGGNHTNSDIVTTVEAKASTGGVTVERRIIYCEEAPEECKEALEAAAASAEQNSNYSMGTGKDMTLDDWMNSPSRWPSLPPIHFPTPGKPGIPLENKDIQRHTQVIIRSIR